MYEGVSTAEEASIVRKLASVQVRQRQGPSLLTSPCRVPTYPCRTQDPAPLRCRLVRVLQSTTGSGTNPQVLDIIQVDMGAIKDVISENQEEFVHCI